MASAVAKILLEENNIDTKPFEDTIRPMVRAADANLTTAGNSAEKESEGMTEEAARDVSHVSRGAHVRYFERFQRRNGTHRKRRVQVSVRYEPGYRAVLPNELIASVENFQR